MSDSKSLTWVWEGDEKVVGYRKTPYVKYNNTSHTWTCLMCKTGDMHREVVHKHLNGLDHRSKYARLKQARLVLAKNDWCNEFIAPSASQLQLERWQWHINHLCHEYINNHAESLPDDKLLNPIYATLCKYKKKEKLSLLELAIWKSKCLVHHAEVTGVGNEAHGVTMQEIDDYWALNETFNPRQYRREIRIKSEISVIVDNTLLFLGSSF